MLMDMHCLKHQFRPCMHIYIHIAKLSQTNGCLETYIETWIQNYKPECSCIMIVHEFMFKMWSSGDCLTRLLVCQQLTTFGKLGFDILKVASTHKMRENQTHHSSWVQFANTDDFWAAWVYTHQYISIINYKRKGWDPITHVSSPFHTMNY